MTLARSYKTRDYLALIHSQGRIAPGAAGMHGREPQPVTAAMVATAAMMAPIVARMTAVNESRMTQDLRSSDRRTCHYGTRIHVQGPWIWKE